MRNYTAYICNH